MDILEMFAYSCGFKSRGQFHKNCIIIIVKSKYLIVNRFYISVKTTFESLD